VIAPSNLDMLAHVPQPFGAHFLTDVIAVRCLVGPLAWRTLLVAGSEEKKCNDQ